ncbi:heme o synthase [Ornithinibacillus halophilus]|uniref:Protoheme IX farnesyltransferase n=1 Tax=Ornithinibacillus halophilus TaxID=930117 RepID=A0A1M5C2L1_9BACI|nr:heme o synthase [Ornithinibacillus halophilus]SHF48672.1 protoheme IX farnesyltransferase [Ornithinibacillus halophilus]
MDNIDTTSSHVVTNTNVSRGNNGSLIKDLKALVKVGIVNSNLITTLTGFILALHFTGSSFLENMHLFLLTISGTALVIAGGCILNNWYDVDIDPVMSRTKNRPTVTGSLSMKFILYLGLGISVVGHILLLLTSVEAAVIAFFGWFTYVVLYTMWSKRKYTLNTIVGSFSGAVPPLIGWAAIDTSIHIVPITLFLIMFIWQTPHFLALAMKKIKEYEAANIPMLPVVYGFEFTKRQIIVYIACLLPLPFFLASLGTTFIVIATILNIGWLILGLSGFLMKDDLKWANLIFIYSLNYLTILFITMAVISFVIPLH